MCYVTVTLVSSRTAVESKSNRSCNCSTTVVRTCSDDTVMTLSDKISAASRYVFFIRERLNRSSLGLAILSETTLLEIIASVHRKQTVQLVYTICRRTLIFCKMLDAIRPWTIAWRRTQFPVLGRDFRANLPTNAKSAMRYYYHYYCTHVRRMLVNFLEGWNVSAANHSILVLIRV